MANTPQEVQRLMRIIQFGKSNALTAKDIARTLNYSLKNNQVETRKLIRYAIQLGNVIISSNKGYWRSTDRAEIDAHTQNLLDRAQDVSDRSAEIKAAWNQANPNNIIP